MRHESESAWLGGLRQMVVAIFVLGFAASWLPSPAAAQTRTWTDSTGKFTVQAKFVGLSDGKVTLEREDGTQITLPLEKLSAADQKVVAAMGNGGDSPFQPASPPSKTAPKKKSAAADEEPPVGKTGGTGKGGKKAAADDDEGDASGGPKIVASNWTRAVQLQLPAAAAPWSLAIAAPAKPAGAAKGSIVALPAKLDFFEHDKGMAVNSICGRAVAGYILDKAPAGISLGGRGGDRGSFGKGDPVQRGRPAENLGQTRLVLCDLKSGKVLGQGTAPGKMIVLALSDSGTQVLMGPDTFASGDKSQVQLWSLTANGVVQDLQWSATDNSRPGAHRVVWGSFLDDDRVATLAEDGLLTVWKASTARPLFYTKIDGGCRPAISPDRKYLAFATTGAVGVLDLAAGAVAGRAARRRGV